MSGPGLARADVPLPGGGKAVYNAGGLAFYRHADWLGTSRLASTPAQGVYAEAAYAPLGETYSTSGVPAYSFTGQTADVNGGQYDFLLREYNPIQGRWWTPDPAGLAAVDPSNPQTWNRYSYVGNQPLSNIDPLGLLQLNPPDPCKPVEFAGGGLHAMGVGNCGGQCIWIMGDPLCIPNGGPIGPPPGPGAGQGSGGGASDPWALGPLGPAPGEPTCPLSSPSGDFTVEPPAVAQFDPALAQSLSNAIALLNANGIVPEITSGFRTGADQLRMIRGGSGPNPAARISWHQVGQAVDFNTRPPDFSAIVSAMKFQGLNWGGDFFHVDLPHFQTPAPNTSPTPGQIAACAGGQ